MVYLTVNNVYKSYYGVPILKDINLTVKQGDKMAIVGRNGAGKSTFAHIIAGEEPYDSGYISRLKGIKVGLFTQQRFLDTNQTVYEAFLDVFQKEQAIERELKALDTQYQKTKDPNTLMRYNQLLALFEEIGGFTYRHRIETMLNRFGFKSVYHQPIKSLSGGEQTRLALAKLLLEEPDILILDEPTNHLDLETTEFLESFLRGYKKSVLLISHDRYFLNQIVNHVFEIENTKGTLYKGNYDDYLREKERRFEQELKRYEQQQKFIQKEKAFIERNIARASTTKRAQARLKRLEKMNIMEAPKIDARKMNLTFKLEKTSGKIVIQTDRLEIGYDTPILKPISFEVRKGEKIAIIGGNGTGKSTLLKTIQGIIPPLSGSIRFGTGVNKGYFDQETARMSSNKTVLDEIWDEHRTMLEREVRGLLARFLFTGEDVYKSVGELSGGERVRLRLVQLFLSRANLLILDEVENNLDMVSKEIVEKALMDYKGTVLFVSHDRYFINRIATKIFAIEDGQLVIYPGNYDEYLMKKSARRAVVDPSQTEAKKTSDYEAMKQRRNTIQRYKRKQQELEEAIKGIEKELHDLKAEQFNEEVYMDHEKALALQRKIKDLEAQQQTLLEHWFEISEWLEKEGI